MEAGAKQPRGLMPRRFNGETIAQAFAEAEKIRHQLEQLGGQMERLEKAQLSAEGFSALETGVANGTDPVEVRTTTPIGGVTIVETIAVKIDPAAVGNAVIFLNDVSRPLGTCATGGVAVLGAVAFNQEPSIACPFTLPSGFQIGAHFRGPVPAAGTTCTLHVTGKQLD